MRIFQVEKVLGQFGWGRWKVMRDALDVKDSITEADIEHISRHVLWISVYAGYYRADKQWMKQIFQNFSENLIHFIWSVVYGRRQLAPLLNAHIFSTHACKSFSCNLAYRVLLLHCIREYRGDEKIREFVWRLIIPKGGQVTGKNSMKKKSTVLTSVFHEGWAALPEFNPPAFAVDSSFQRHVHRHANKLLIRMHQLHILNTEVSFSQNLFWSRSTNTLSSFRNQY